jgi:hypothetical protein
MLSKTELEFLETPESFEPSYCRILRFRIKSKVKKMKSDVALLKAHGISVTENCNGEKNPNQAAFEKQNLEFGAPAGIRTRVFGSKGRNT